MVEDDKEPHEHSCAILETTIDEQRRVYDWISSSYDQIRVRILTFLGAGLALLTYLYSDGNLFIPKEDYGKIFYFFGLAMILVGVATLTVALRPLPWEFPTQSRDINDLNKFKSRYAYLYYVKDRYSTCYTINISSYNLKQKLLNYSLYPLLFGGMILVVLKLFK